jgi:hypothetical protein
MSSIGKKIKKESTKITKKIIEPVKKEANKATQEITKLQKMVKCPISVTSNFPKCATNYMLDLLGYLLFAWATMIRLVFWVLPANAYIWALNWFILPVIRMIINVCMDLLLRPEWKVNKSFEIPYFDWFISHKNDVIRIVNLFFPFFNRTKDMNKCYCASSLVWLFQPLQVKEQTWSQWVETTFGPIFSIFQWMFSLYKESFTGKTDAVVSSAPIFVAGGILCILCIYFWIIDVKIEIENPSIG